MKGPDLVTQLDREGTIPAGEEPRVGPDRHGREGSDCEYLLQQKRVPGVGETVPSYRALLVYKVEGRVVLVGRRPASLGAVSRRREGRRGADAGALRRRRPIAADR